MGGLQMLGWISACANPSVVFSSPLKAAANYSSGNKRF